MYISMDEDKQKNDNQLSLPNNNKRKILLTKDVVSSPSIIGQVQIQKLYKHEKGFTVLRHCSYQEIRDPGRYKKLHKFTKTIFTQFKSTPNLNSGNSIQIKTVFKQSFNFLKRSPESETFAKYLASNKVTCDTPIIHNNIDSNKINEKDKKNSYMTDIHSSDLKSSNNNNRKRVPKLSINAKSTNYTTKENKPDSNSDKMFVFRLLKILFLFFLPVSLGILFLSLNTNTDFLGKLDVTNITKHLRNSLYGQTHIINNLEYNFNLIQNNKVFLFFGGVGVGKTYTAQIIERNFPYKNNIQKYVFCSNIQYKTLETKIISNLVQNDHNLIIIDNYSPENVYHLLSIINEISINDCKYILIIIFNNLNEISMDFKQDNHNNIQYKAKYISDVFLLNNIRHSLYIFNDLSVEDIKRCIRNALQKRGRRNDEDNVNEVLNNINYEFSGCKSVYAKIALLHKDKYL